jgi:type I restriction enzyme M protein
MAVVLPQGALFRKEAEGRIRQALVDQDLIEAVIGLAPNIFYGTGLAPAVVVLRRNKPRARRGKVLITDASSLFQKGRAQNFLDPEHAAQIVAWVHAFKDVPDRVKIVSLDEIRSGDWTLNISRFVMRPVGEHIPPLGEAVAAFKQAVTGARAAEERLRQVLTEGGWLS